MRRPVASSLLILTMVFAAVLPPAHIHLAVGHDDHDHAAAVEHSHWSAHQSSRASFDDNDGRVIFVDRPARMSSAVGELTRPAAILVALITLPPVSTFTVAERPTSGNSPRDGPARTRLAFRGPPLVL
jgi:hypothetical protein